MPAKDRMKQQLIRDLVRENLDTVSAANPTTSAAAAGP